MGETFSVKMTTYKVLKRIRVSTLINSGFNGEYRNMWFTEAKDEEPTPINRCWFYLENMKKSQMIWILDYQHETVNFVTEEG